MARYIDADRIHPNVTWMPSANALFKKEIDRQPTADVVKVVRCKDCKYYHPRQFDYDGCFFGAVPVYREPNDFCSDGKPREVSVDG